MLLKQITAVVLFTATGAALAGNGKIPTCNITMFLPAYDNVPTWTSAWVIAATASLLVVLAVRLRRNRAHA